jgi:hypothetical protein
VAYTNAGITTARSPSVNISVRAPCATAVATKVVPRSTPWLYDRAASPSVRF